MPNFGVALNFIWEMFLSDSKEAGGNPSTALMDDIAVSAWLETENLNELALLFLTNGVTGKGVAVMQPTDMMDMGVTDSAEIMGFQKARAKLLACTEQCQTSPFSKACHAEPPASIAEPSEKSQSLSAPVTPEASTAGSAKKNLDVSSPMSTSPWKRMKKSSPMSTLNSATAAGSSMKDDVGLSPFKTVTTCANIWNDDLSNQTIQVLLMSVGNSYKNVKWNRLELVVYGLDEQNRWVKLIMIDAVGERFLSFKKQNLSDQDTSFLMFSSVSHARGRGNGGDSSSEDSSMQFKVTAHCRFKTFEPCDVWSEVSPMICEDFSDLSTTANGTRVFVHARIHEFDDIITSPNCSARRMIQIMDKHGHKRQLTAWEPLHATFPWCTDKVVTILGAKIERTKYHGFVINSDSCILENDDDDLSSFSRKVISRYWPEYRVPLESPAPFDFRGVHGLG